MADYKIELGIDFNDSELKNIKKQLTSLTDNTHRIRIDIDNSRLLKQIDHAKRELRGLNSTKGNQPSLTVNTKSLEDSLSRVADVIDEVKKSLGTLDDKSGMKSLLVSINQISNALSKVESESDNLIKSLEALSKKDFSLNFNFKSGNANPVKAMTDYGREARNRTIPQLQEQAAYLQDLLGGYLKADSALEKYLVKIHKFNGISIKNNLLGDMSDTSSLSKQMDALERYIGYLKKIAANKGINLDGFNSEFSKAANELVDDTVKIQSGAKQAEEELDKVGEKLKQVFGSGIDADGLSKVLEPIVTNLGEIKRAVEALSKGVSIDGLTDSFNRLSDTLEHLMNNFRLVRNGFDDIASNNGGTNTGISDIAQQFKAVDIQIDNLQNSLPNLITALRQIGFNEGSINNITRELDNLGISVRNVTSRLNNDGSVTVTVNGVDQLERAVTVMRSVGEDGALTSFGTTISQDFNEIENAYQRLLSITKEMGKLRSKIAGLDTSRNREEIAELTSQLDNLGAEYNELFAITGRNLSGTQLGELAREAETASEKLDIVNAKMADTRAYREITDAFNKLKSISDKMGQLKVELAGLDPEKNGAEIAELTSQLNNLGTEYNELFAITSRNLSENQIEELAKSAEEASNKVEKLNSRMVDASNANTVKELNKEMANLAKLQEKISRTKLEIGKLEAIGGKTNEVEELQRQLEELENTYEHLMFTFMKKMSSNEDILPVDDVIKFSEEFNAAIKKAENDLKQFEARIADTRANLTKNIELKLETGKFATQVDKVVSDSKKLSNIPDDLRISIKEVESAFEGMKTASSDGKIDELIESYKKYLVVLEDVENQLKQNKIAQQDASNRQKLEDDQLLFQSKIDAWLRTNSAAVDKFGYQMLHLREQAESCDRVTLNHLQKEFKQLDMEAEAAGLKIQSLTDRIKTQFSKYAAYFSVAEVIMYATQAIKDMFEQVKLIDSAMTELKKVTDETDASYNRFLKNAASKSKELGTTIDGFINSTAEFAKLGYGFKESQGLAEVANIYAVVGDEIEGVEGATESLVSTLAAFRHEMGEMSDSDFAMGIVDKFNEVANKYSISSGGIGEALQRAASSMAAANNTLDETIALTTAANEVAQNPEKVGNALKTMSMRLRAAKTELEDAGESTEGMAESTASLRQEIKALSGVDIMLNENTFKSTYQILDELSQKWEDLSDIAQASIIELVAGKHQGNIMSSLMSNFDTARKALDTSLNSSGSALKEHAKWSESLEARLNKLKATWQSLSQTFMNSDFLKVCIDFATKFIDVLDNLIEKIGAFPTIVGGLTLLDAIFSKNKIFNIFQLLNTDLDGFTNKIGIANKSLSELIGAFNSGKNGTGFKGFFSGLKSVGNVLNNTLTKADLSSIKEYNSLIDQCVGSQTAWYRTMQNASPAAKDLVASANGGKVAMNGLATATKTSTLATMGMTVAATAMSAAITMGISALITWGIKKLDEWIVTADELAEKAEEVTSKYKEQHEELLKLKGDYDTSDEDSMISKYAKLSKGVDDLGKNVSLTTDEYSEYQDIVNGIAGQIPSLVTGYDSQGNAILSCKGNVEELTEAYEKLIKAQNDSVLSGENASNIVKDFKNAIKDAEKSDISDTETTTHTVDALEKMLNGSFSQDKVSTLLNNLRDSKQQYGLRTQIVNALEEKGLESDLHWYSLDSAYDEFIADAIEKHPDVVREIINDFNNNLELEAEGVKSQAAAVLSNAFDISSSEYAGIGEEMQNLAYQIVNSFDAEKFNDIIGDGTNENAVKNYINSILDVFKKLEESGDDKKLEAAFNLKTQFNSGEVSYGDYVNGLRNVEEFIDDIDGLDNDVKKQIKLALNTEEVIKNYDALKNRLTSEKYDIQMEVAKAEAFLNDLSASEYAVAVDLILSDKIDLNNFDANSLREYIEKQARIDEALSFTIGITVEAENIEALNTALAESVSATGLSAESIGVLKSRYSELESQGYDLSSMFEETSNGIHLNRAAVNELEEAYASQKLSEVDENLGVLKDRYDELTVEINNASDASERAGLYREQQAIVQKINDLSVLASQYKGLTSAYNDWLSAEEAGQERDMYEQIIEGFKNVGDEIKRGWMDDGTIKFLELLTGQTDLASKSGKELKEIYDSLDDTIGNSGYSIRDFFTVDDDGNSTNGGVYNFLETVESFESKLGDVIKRNGDGNIIGFDFEVAGGDKAIEEALGISEELVQIMVRAADDAGFVVTLEGAYAQLADLKIEAESANDALKKLYSTSNGKFGTDYTFDFGVDDIGEATIELDKAKEVLNQFKKDGVVDLTMDGAEEALKVAETFQIIKNKLEEPVYMSIDTNELQEELQEPVKLFQEFEKLTQEKDLLNLSGQDTQRLGEIDTELNNIATSLYNLPEDTKVQLGIDDLNIEQIREELENGTVEIPTELTIEANMDKSLEDLVTLGLLEQGLISEKEAKIRLGIEVEKVDTSAIEEAIEKAELSEEDAIIIKAFAQVFGIENVEDLVYELGELDDKTIQAIAKVFGEIDVERLNDVVSGLDDKTVQAIAEALGEGDVEGLKTTISGLDDKTVQAIAKAFGYDDVNDLYTAIDKLDPKTVQAIADVLGITDVDSLKTAIDRLTNKNVDVVANTSGESDVNSLKSAIDKIKDKTVTITTKVKKFFSNIFSSGDDDEGGSGANGTANVNGTTGRAFKQGSWGTKNSGTALVGELGREVLVRDGRYYTIGDNGAEFIKYRKGDIIFNHVQSEELFKNGKVTSGGGRAKALSGGTAFSKGTGGGIGKVIHSVAIDGTSGVARTTTKTTTTSTNGGSKSTKQGLDDVGGKSVTSSSSGSGSSDKEFKETLDWIETKISRIERVIDKLELKANSIFKSWTERNKALVDEISKVQEEIEIQEQAYERYMQEANNVGLASSWAEKVRNGDIDISTITDESLKEKINDYKKFYESALDCQDAIEELKEKEAELYKQRLENVSTQYDGILGVIEHEKNILDEYISQAEAQGHLVSSEYYNALTKNEEENLAKLKQEKADMLVKLQEAMSATDSNGNPLIVKGSEAYYEMIAAIDEVTLSIAESETALLEYEQTLQQLSWETFDILQDRISAITEEADFLIELMSSDKLYDDNGKLTDEGMATMGLHGQNYNVYMAQADKYAEEVARLNKEIEKDPYDQDLISRRDELLELQQESILSAQQEKEAIRDLVSEGIELELDALQELIDKKNEALESERDLYEYQKKVKEQTEEIASLEKQLAAYSGDDSEEAKQKIQQIKVDLESARQDLEETEYDKFISDSAALLDELYLEYEEILNQRLDNLDALVADVITEVNANASTISTTISEKADLVGYTLSDSMTSIWDTNSTKINDVITVYGEKFSSAQTTTNNALSTINTNLQNMITQLNTIAKTNVKSASVSSAENSKEANTVPKKPTPEKKEPAKSETKTITVGGKINASGAQIYDYAGDTSGERQLYRDDPIYTVLGEKNGYLKVRYHKLSSGVTGWFKKSDVKAYASGKQNFLNDEIAWTQDGGREFIVRPSDGAILTPIAKGDSVLNTTASGNIWKMANDPAEFIKNNLKLDIANIPNSANVHSNYTQHLDKVVFNLPNVKNYPELLKEMQRDKNFENLVQSMTINRVAGQSYLAKGKSIR